LLTRSGISVSCPGRSHRRPSAATPASSGSSSISPDTADRWLAPSPPPIHTAAPPPRTRTPAHRVFEVLAERRLARQLRNRFHLQPALRAAHSVELHHHKGLILSPRQIPHRALPDLLDLPAAAATSRADQDLIAALAPYPEFQRPRLLVNLMPVNAVPRPVQNLGEFSSRQPCEFSSPDRREPGVTPSRGLHEPLPPRVNNPAHLQKPRTSI